MTELALIGKGRWGQNYISTIAKMTEVNLASDNTKTRDYPDLFKKDDIDGVIIASPTNTHYEIAKEFLSRDFNLLIEKPITVTYEESLELQKLNREHQSVVLCGHIQMYDPGYVELKRSLNKVGKIHKMFFKGLQSPVTRDSTELENWGPHPIYLFLDIAEKKPVHVSVEEKNNGNVRLELNFGNDLIGIADIGSISTKKERELSILSSNGILTFDWSGPVKRLNTKNGNGKEEDIPFDTSRSPLELEVSEFILCIKNSVEPRTPLSLGVEVMKVIDEANNILRSSKTIYQD
jgi:UDP-2-acetamido-3-amino-2,3-dideoxy-glucuronate N-acetyltransferase